MDSNPALEPLPITDVPITTNIFTSQSTSNGVNKAESSTLSAKKNNLLGVLRKIKPTVAMSISSNVNFVTNFSPSVFVNSGNTAKKKSSPPILFLSPTSKIISDAGKQNIASVTVTSSDGSNQEFRKKLITIPTLLPITSLQEKVQTQKPVTIEKNEANGITNVENDETYSDNVLSHMLDFLYKGVQSRSLTGGFPLPQGCGDQPSLEAPKQNRKTGVEVIMECMEKGTPQLKDLLLHSVDVILECKCCRGLFRSVENLVKHKKLYCKNSGHMSKLLGRQSNSSLDEDKVIKNLLNVLNPQDNNEEIVMDFEPIPTNPNAVFQTVNKHKANQSFPNGSFKTFTPQSNAKSTPQYIILNQPKGQISRGSLKTIQPSTINNSIASNIIVSGANKPHSVVNVTSTPVMNGKIVKPDINKTPIAMSPDLKASQADNKIKPRCPLCQKEMAERKNVKRHLVHVHMLSVQDTWKLMHRTMPLSTPSPVAKKKSAPPPQKTPRSCEELEKMCVETLPIGDDRKINVLPKTYSFPDSYCPICSRPMSSRNNVRRHMLESHDFLLQGDKKYYQLKILLVKDCTIMDGSNRSMRRFYTSSSKMDLDQIKAELESLESLKREKEMREEAEKKAAEKKMAEIKVVDKKLQDKKSPDKKSEKKSPDKKSPDKKVTITSSVETSSSERPVSPVISKTEAKNMIDVTNCKCLTCEEEFCRRQTLKNHMLQSHKWSKNLFNSVYDDAYARESEDSEDVTEDSSDEKENEVELADKANHVEHGNEMVMEPLNEANRKVVKTVLLHKIVPASSNSKLTIKSESITTNAVTKLNVLQNNTAGLKRKMADNSFDDLPMKKGKLFDTDQNLCCICDEELDSTSLLKRHMIEVHSCTMDQVLGASRDNKMVDPEVQKHGESKGYDIENAKCLLCSKYFFMRQALKKHMNKVHHLTFDSLQGLNSDEDNYESDENSKQEKKSAGFQLRDIVKTEESSDEVIHDEDGRSSTPFGLLLNISEDKFAITPNSAERSLSATAAVEANQILPPNMISPHLMKCLKCKQKFPKLWDLKVHILKHIGLGIYACKFCNGEIKCAYHLDQIMDHISNDHSTVSKRSATNSLKNAKINNKALWEVYGLPTKK